MDGSRKAVALLYSLFIAKKQTFRYLYTFLAYILAISRNSRLLLYSLFTKLIIYEKFSISFSISLNNHLQKKLYRNHGELPKFYAEGTHESIIPRSIFEEANALKQARKESFYYETPSKHTAFSQFIECETCGKKYKRAVRNGEEVWNCSTFIKYGKTHCWTKQIPSSVLKCLCMDVLGLNDFDENIVRERVEKISVPKKGLLVFHLATGKKVTRQWENAPLALRGKNKIPRVSKGKIVWQEQ